MESFNIYYRRDGRWEGRISQGKREDGKQKFKYFLVIPENGETYQF